LQEQPFKTSKALAFQVAVSEKSLKIRWTLPGDSPGLLQTVALSGRKTPEGFSNPVLLSDQTLKRLPQDHSGKSSGNRRKVRVDPYRRRQKMNLMPSILERRQTTSQTLFWQPWKKPVQSGPGLPGWPRRTPLPHAVRYLELGIRIARGPAPWSTPEYDGLCGLLARNVLASFWATWIATKLAQKYSLRLVKEALSALPKKQAFNETPTADSWRSRPADPHQEFDE
jgi:hypothetical protein